MDHGNKKHTGSRAVPKKGTPLGLIITLAVAGGAAVGSAGTYLYFKPLVAARQSAPPAAVASPPAQAATMPAIPAMPAQGQLTPQPPGPVPPGKVWSPEHGHWHDVSAAFTPASPPPGTTPAPAPPTLTPPAATTPAPVAEPAVKKE